MADRTRGSERFGWGPSALASREEQRAYQASILMPEIAAGRASVADLPEAYGGRPTGQSRRAIRMQGAWDQARKQQLEEQKMAQQMEFERKQNMRAELDSAIKLYGFEKQQEQDLLNKRIMAQTEAAEANFFKFANTLDPNDPSAASKMADYISDNPALAQSDSAQKSFYYFQQASSNSAQALANQQQKEINTKLSEARQLGIDNKELSKVQDIDPNTGEVFTDVNKLQELIDTTKGQRTLKEEERKESRGEYRPISTEQAQDEFDVAKAEFDAVVDGGFDEEDIEYRRADVRLKRAEAQLKVSQGKTKEEPQKEKGYEVGKSYSGMIYLGGDPNSESSWKKK
jgi:hypothetical protein